MAATLFNEARGQPRPVLHGVVTTGAAWKFLRVEGKAVTLDLDEYYIDSPSLILGILVGLLSDP